MKKPELTDVGWLGPKDEMDCASHRFGKCSNCDEIIRKLHLRRRALFSNLARPLRGGPHGSSFLSAKRLDLFR
jgi:hypothetical protein